MCILSGTIHALDRQTETDRQTDGWSDGRTDGFAIISHSARVGAVMPRHGDWQLEAAGIGGVWGRGGRVHGCGA